MRRQIGELKIFVKVEKKKNAALSLKMKSVSDQNAKLKKCVKFMQSLDLDEALVHEKENIRLKKERQKQDRELQKAKQNYQVTKQILEQTISVKMSYQKVIDSAL